MRTERQDLEMAVLYEAKELENDVLKDLILRTGAYGHYCKKGSVGNSDYSALIQTQLCLIARDDGCGDATLHI